MSDDLGHQDSGECVVLDGARLGFDHLADYRFTFVEHDLHELGMNLTYFATVQATDTHGEILGDARLSCSQRAGGPQTIFVSAVTVTPNHRGRSVASAMIELARWYWGEDLAITSAGPVGDTAAGQRLMRSVARRVSASV